MENETSIKGLIQSMLAEGIDIIQGTVIELEPMIKVQAANDEKLIIRQTSLIIPRHMTDYELKVTIESNGSEQHAQETGTGLHSHIETRMKIYNALEIGDVIQMLVFAKGKKYYVLDKVVEE